MLAVAVESTVMAPALHVTQARHAAPAGALRADLPLVRALPFTASATPMSEKRHVDTLLGALRTAGVRETEAQWFARLGEPRQFAAPGEIEQAARIGAQLGAAGAFALG